jgi:hypothetical protein
MPSGEWRLEPPAVDVVAHDELHPYANEGVGDAAGASFFVHVADQNKV